jgi:6-pyruvoyltetrahydropterin/6-carboxytetrahydropterin synthase
MHRVHRYHDISAGHRVVGHESKCRHLHGHNYRVHFVCEPDSNRRSKEIGSMGNRGELDLVGRVIDFSVVKEKLCMWLEDNWDHKFLAWEEDELIQNCIVEMSSDNDLYNLLFAESIVTLPFNPTAENLAEYLVEFVGPQQLHGTGVRLVEVRIEETAKCHVTYGVK